MNPSRPPLPPRPRCPGYGSSPPTAKRHLLPLVPLTFSSIVQHGGFENGGGFPGGPWRVKNLIAIQRNTAITRIRRTPTDPRGNKQKAAQVRCLGLSVRNSKALFNAGTLRHDFIGKQILQAGAVKVDEDQLAA